jgi:hypothetical protein
MNALQLQLLVMIFSGWVNRSQQDVIEYLQKENRVLREQLGGKALRFTDQQRRRLAAKARSIGRKRLFEIGTLVTPDTLLRWYRKLIARKYIREVRVHSEKRESLGYVDQNSELKWEIDTIKILLGGRNGKYISFRRWCPGFYSGKAFG